MSYIYDILLNFNEDFYEFYDWNKDDKLTHIRKMPIFKISNGDLINIVNSKVRLDKKFLERIENKTEAFTRDNIDVIQYGTLLCTDKRVIAVLLDYNGIVLSKSDLLIDEHEDILDSFGRYTEYALNPVILKRQHAEDFKTRKQREIERFVINEIRKHPKDRLKYLLYECEREICDNKEQIIIKLHNAMTYNNMIKMYNFFKLISANQKNV